MISQRLRGLSQDGEAIDGLIPKLQSLFSSAGISIEDQNGELRSTFDILQDLAGVWDQLSSKQKQYFGEKVAGNRQVKTLNAIMQNWDVVADTIDKANNAQGEALRGNEMYMDSIQGRMTQLQSAFQELAKTTIDSDFVKNIVSAGTGVAKLITSLGGLTPILTTVLGSIIAIRGVKILEGLSNIKNALISAATGANVFASSLSMAGAILAGIGAGIALGKGIISLLQALEVLPKKYSDLEAASEKAQQNYSEEENKLSDLNTELEKTQERLKVLENKNSLTIVEQDEYNRLKNTNDELERQIKLQRIKANIAEEEARNAAIDQFEGLENQSASSRLKIGDATAKAASNLAATSWNEFNNIINQITSDLSEFQAKDGSYKSAVSEAYNTIGYFKSYLDEAELAVNSLIDNSKDVNATIQSDEYKTAVAIRDYWEAAYKDRLSILTQYQGDIEEILGPYETIQDPKNNRENAFNQRKQEYTNIDNMLLSLEDTPIKEVLSRIVTAYSDSISEVKAILQSSGDITVEDLGKPQFEEMIQEFERYGYSAEDAAQIFKESFGGIGDEKFGPQLSISTEDVVGKLLQDTESYTKTLTSAIAEQEKAGQLSSTTIAKLLSDEGLPGISECLEKTAKGYRLNTEQLEDYIKAQNEETRLNAVAGIMERRLAIEDLTAAMATLTDEQERQAYQDQITQLENEAIQLEAVANEAYNAADAFEAMREASKTSNEDANHTEAQKYIKAMEEAWEVGKVGTDDFKAGMDYLLGEGWYEHFHGNLDKAWEEAEKRKKKYFADDDYDSVNNFVNALVKAGYATKDADGNIEMLKNKLTGALPTIEQMAETFGLSKEAVRDLLELVNSYSFEDKIQLIDDGEIDSVEKLAAAQKKLEEIQQQRAEAAAELEKMQKERADTSAIEEQNKKVQDLTDSEKDLAKAIEVANESLEAGVDTPLTFEEALAKLKEYEDAIKALNDNGITIPVELGEDRDAIVKLLTDESTTLTVDAKPGEIDEKVTEIQELVDYLKEHSTLSTTVTATVTGLGEKVIKALQEYNKETTDLEGKKEVVTGVKVTGAGIATILIGAFTAALKGIPDETTATVRAETDKQSVTQAKSDVIDLPSPEELTVMYHAKTGETVEESKNKLKDLPSPEELTAMYLTDVDEAEYDKTEKDLGDLQKDREVHYKTIFDNPNNSDLVDPTKLTDGQVREYQKRVGDNNAIPMILPEDPIIKPKINKTAFGEEFEQALQEAESEADPVEVEAEVNGQSWGDAWKKAWDEGSNISIDGLIDVAKQLSDMGYTIDEIIGALADTQEEENALREAIEDNSWEDAFDEAAGHPFDATPEINEEEVADQVQEGIEQGAENAEPKVDAEVGVDQDQIEDEVQEAVENIPEQNAPVGADTASMESQIKESVKKLEPPPVAVKIKQKMEQSSKSKTPETVTQTIRGNNTDVKDKIQAVQNKASEGATIPIKGDGSEAEKEVDELDKKIETPKTKPLQLNVGNWLNILKSLESRLGKTVNKIVNITYKEKNKNPAKAKGTKHAEGGLTLVDEKGAELIEHTKQGTFEMGTNDGARFTHLDKGDVVHTAEETRKILKRASGIGQFIKNGLDGIGSLVGNAFATGVSGRARIKPKRKKDDDSSSKRSSGSRSGSGSSSGVGSRSGSSSGSSADTELEKWNKWTKRFFDWAELRLEYLRDITEKWADESAAAVGMWAKNDALEKAISSVDKRINETKQAMNLYNQQAEKILDQSGLSEERKERLRNGMAIDINEYNEDTQQKIKDYLEWYNKMQDCKKALRDLEAQEKEFAKQSLQNIVDEYEKMSKLEQGNQDINSAEREYRKAVGLGIEGASNFQGGIQYGDYISDIDSEQKKLNNTTAERAQLQAQLNDLMSRGLVIYGDNTWQEYTEKLKALDAEVYKSMKAIQALKDEAISLTFSQLQYQIDSISASVDSLNQSMSLGNAQGSLGRSDKSFLINLSKAETQNQIDLLEQENDAYRSLRDSFDVNSEKYQEYDKKIKANEQSILKNKQAIAEYDKQLNQLQLDYIIDEYNELDKAINNINDTMSKNLLIGKEITSKLYKNLIQSGNDQIENLKQQKEYYNTLMDSLVERYGEDAKTSDLYRQYQQEVDNIDSSIKELDMSIIQWQKDMENLPIQKLGWALDSLKDKADRLQDALSMKEAVGKEVKISDYTSLINNANAQITKLMAENEKFEAQQKGMDVNSEAYQELQEQINNNDASIRDLNSSIVQWQNNIKNISVEKLGWALDKLKARADELQDALDLKEALGQQITVSDYNRLIKNAQDRIKKLNAENAEYIAQQFGMDINSKAYQELQKKIDSNNASMRDLDASTVQWKKDIEDLKLKKLENQLSSLNETLDKLNNKMSLHEAQGLEETSDIYKKLIQNGMDRIEILKQENKLLKAQQKGMDKNSDAYQELQKQIASNNNEISNIKVSQEQWNDSIIDIGINNLQKYRNSISKSNEQLDRQKKLQEALLELQKADSQRRIRTYVEGQGFVYQRDEDEYRKAQENLESIIKDDLLSKIDDLIEALEESKNDSNVYDKNGNLIGTKYNTPQLGSLSNILSEYYANNANANIDVGVLKDAFGKNVLPSASSSKKNTSINIGDIIVNSAKDGNELAKAIVNQFPNALLQALYSKQ